MTVAYQVDKCGTFDEEALKKLLGIFHCLSGAADSNMSVASVHAKVVNSLAGDESRTLRRIEDAKTKGAELALYKKLKKIRAEKSEHLAQIALHQMLARHYHIIGYQLDFPEEVHQGRLE